jgi:hypothetical protein
MRLSTAQYAALTPRSKYGNVKTGNYASKREAKRAAELKLLEQSGEIRNLREQVSFLLIPACYVNGRCVERSCKYVADFVFEEKVSDTEWKQVVEDSKGFRDNVYKIKRKLFRQIHGFGIRES